MSSTVHFYFALILLFCLINTIFAEPICTREHDYLGNHAKCRNVISINTTAIEQQLTSLANPSIITNVQFEGVNIHLSSSTLKPFVNLERFMIDGRNGSHFFSTEPFEISTIDSNAFVENKKLDSISLYGINFSTVENLRGIMQPLFGRLTWMALGHCSFSQTPSANESSYDPFQVFNEFTKLEYVEIRYSGLTTIPANAFQKSANSLLTLHLELNFNITTIDRNAFKRMNKLLDLDLANNQITEIESGTFDDLTSLMFLKLSSNHISQLPNILFGISGSQLRELFLSSNKLTIIHPTALKGLTKLEGLYLNYNEIRSIEPGTFDDLHSIREIDLHNNRISHLPRNLFEKTRLQYLYIQNNPIGNLSGKNFTTANDSNGTLTVYVGEV